MLAALFVVFPLRFLYFTAINRRGHGGPAEVAEKT